MNYLKRIKSTIAAIGLVAMLNGCDKTAKMLNSYLTYNKKIHNGKLENGYIVKYNIRECHLDFLCFNREATMMFYKNFNYYKKKEPSEIIFDTANLDDIIGSKEDDKYYLRIKNKKIICKKNYAIIGNTHYKGPGSEAKKQIKKCNKRLKYATKKYQKVKKLIYKNYIEDK